MSVRESGKILLLVLSSEKDDDNDSTEKDEEVEDEERRIAGCLVGPRTANALTVSQANGTAATRSHGTRTTWIFPPVMVVDAGAGAGACRERGLMDRLVISIVRIFFMSEYNYSSFVLVFTSFKLSFASLEAM